MIEKIKNKEKLNPSLYVVGIGFDLRGVGDDSSDGAKVGIWPFAFRETGDEFPLLTELDKVSAEKYLHPNKTLSSKLLEVYGVKEGGLSYILSEDVLPTLQEEQTRYNLGYHLLGLAEFDKEEEKPKELRQALRNTGNLFLHSVGVNQWIEEKDLNNIKEYYDANLKEVWGKALKKPSGEVNICEEQVKILREGKEIKMIQDSGELAEMGESLLFVLEWAAKKNEADIEIIVADPGMYGLLKPDVFNSVVVGIR